jgi:hypothetical protein
MVENGQVVVRPINYLAMSYDHRIIDGREAVSGPGGHERSAGRSIASALRHLIGLEARIRKNFGLCRFYSGAF